MQESPTFQVYNASAGSGKTFTLVKEYLKILLSSSNSFKFQQILAVTFTNKAAAEMKERVLKNLQSFSEEQETDMLGLITSECNLTNEVVFKRSKTILNAILQNYSAFNITTIDSFNYKLIRTFAYDLNLPVNADVELDAQTLLNEAVDVVISKIGENKELTDLLIKYAVQKLEDDKSWDIGNELKSFAKIILNENHSNHLEQLKKVSINEMNDLKSELQKINKLIEEEFKAIGEEGLRLISDNGLQHNQFSYSDLPKFLIKLTKIKHLKVEEIKFEGRLNKTIEENKNFYTAKCDASTKGIIEAISEELRHIYYKSKDLYEQKFGEYIFNSLVIEGLIPLSVLNYIHNSLQELKSENNILLNAEFNKIISSSIKNQPAPFIYERIGEKFRYYFIDEMQDTSQLQWQNLIPLVGNAITSENEQGDIGKLLLVGDAKQSIYRWRGGKAEQFINLSSEEKLKENNPFYIPKNVENLGTNFRSCSEVIEFNNSFFTHLSKFLANPNYSDLFYQGNNQEVNKNKGGFVQLSFLEKPEEENDKENLFPKKVHSIIQNLDPNFKKNEICVLVRTKKHGVEVANYLTEQGIEIISSETLLINNNPKVDFILKILNVIQNPSEKEYKIKALYFLYKYFNITGSKHVFYSSLVHLDNEEFFKELEQFNILFSENYFIQQPLYTAVEYLAKAFKLSEKPDAYIQFFLDEVFEFQQKNQASILDFLEYWELKKDNLSIVSPEASNAVRIMTIHKAKGLEFPVVIYPYNLEVYRQIDPKVWLKNNASDTLKSVLVKYNKKLNYIGEEGEQIFNQRREELELDNFNLLYVALTRAVEQLYVITDFEKPKKEETFNSTSSIFIHYLKEKGLWDGEKRDFTFGNPQKVIFNQKEKNNTTFPVSFISNTMENLDIKVVANSSLLWETEQGEAIKYGNLIHEILSKINTKFDVDEVLSSYAFNGSLNKNEVEEINKIIIAVVEHPKLSPYFKQNNLVLNERTIVTDKNELLIPDRIVIKNGETTVIDYKTGKPEEKYHQQINYYAQVLNNMGYQVVSKILVYIDNKITIEEV
ncbi:UvrD-helicase domain-containing protein [Lutibacter sp. TH_r2]|uniref:UvrD-helicase domain-containing protein n=1 Tax=Lutibacter sp. TH_r2 TaxID=3082083 RepID=UPI002952F14D|nr:UvrD-helicase domain-containing protein [Lutibacter sp. TH_r2]MDV7186475.1 UvrD-helicase domain-containing protein [Lutibacter sp. TH_r2]